MTANPRVLQFTPRTESTAVSNDHRWASHGDVRIVSVAGALSTPPAVLVTPTVYWPAEAMVRLDNVNDALVAFGIFTPPFFHW